jgi:small-conductance mechanosensitive channel
MLQSSGITELAAIAGKLNVFLGRPAVQLQLALIAFAVLLAWLISRNIWQRLEAWHRDPAEGTGEERAAAGTVAGNMRRFALHYGVEVVHAATFPIMTVVLLQIVRQMLTWRDLTGGLLDKVSWIVWSFLALQICVTVLYALFDWRTIRAYHYRLFIPLLWVVVALNILDNLTDLRQLSNVVLTEVFNSPITLGAVFVATVGLYFWTDIIHLFQDLIYQLTVRHTDADPGGTKAALTLMRYILVIVGFVLVLSNLRLGPATLAAVTGGLSVGVGFGLREILSNFISGILLLFEQSLHPGDVIEVDDEVSVVEDVRMRATIVRTLNNDELVIPNQMFFTASFKTYTGSDKTVRVPLLFQTDCRTVPRKTINVMLETALQHPQVLKDPAPSVFVLSYGNNEAHYQLNLWLDNPVQSPQVSSEVRLLMWDAFSAHDISLPAPEMDVRMEQVTPAKTQPIFLADLATNGIR